MITQKFYDATNLPGPEVNILNGFACTSLGISAPPGSIFTTTANKTLPNKIIIGSTGTFQMDFSKDFPLDTLCLQNGSNLQDLSSQGSNIFVVVDIIYYPKEVGVQ